MLLNISLVLRSLYFGSISSSQSKLFSLSLNVTFYVLSEESHLSELCIVQIREASCGTAKVLTIMNSFILWLAYYSHILPLFSSGPQWCLWKIYRDLWIQLEIPTLNNLHISIRQNRETFALPNATWKSSNYNQTPHTLATAKYVMREGKL